VGSQTLAALLRHNAHSDFSRAEADTFLLLHPARFYDSLLTASQRRKFEHLLIATHTAAAAAAAAAPAQSPTTQSGASGAPNSSSSAQSLALLIPPEKKLAQALQLAGAGAGGDATSGVGPRDWLVNFCWTLLRRKQEADEVADCYQQPRRSFPDFFAQTLLLHDSVRGVRSVYLQVATTAVRSLLAYRASSSVAGLVCALLEESISLQGCGLVMAALTAVQRSPVGIDYSDTPAGATTSQATSRAAVLAATSVTAPATPASTSKGSSGSSAVPASFSTSSPPTTYGGIKWLCSLLARL